MLNAHKGAAHVLAFFMLLHAVYGAIVGARYGGAESRRQRLHAAA